MKRLENTKKELIALGFIALLGLATLFAMITMTQSSTGNFVYTAGRIQLEIPEACSTVTNCKTGPAVFISSVGWKHNQHPGQYALCICPENVYTWGGKKPLEYDESKVRIISFVQNYQEGKYLGYE